MLEKFRLAKQAEINALKKAQALKGPVRHDRISFAQAIARPGKFQVIAEYKRASPSRGQIRSDLEVESVAARYQKAGAAALSILTESDFFDGDLGFLERASAATSASIPLLRKDFIFDPLQIEATAQTAASALLLIARMQKDAAELRALRELAERLGIEAVIEIFDQQDLAMAREAGARIIQVNARDLDKLQVDRHACLRLIELAKPQKREIWIAASGIASGEHLLDAANAGFNAALVGGALMEKGDPGENLARMLEVFCR